MRVFLTGATGYIGSAVARELAAAGHRVVALTRLAENGGYLESLGAEPVLGDLRDGGAWAAQAGAADALVHVALETSPARAAVDAAAVDGLIGAARSGRARALVYTSGCFVLGETGDGPAHEDWPTDSPAAYAAWRVPHEREVLRADAGELRAAVVRPGMVYGGRDGLFTDFFATAERSGAAEFVGDGANRWSPVYRGDVARLYRLVVEAGGRGVFHAAEPAARVGVLAMAASRAAGGGGATRRVRLPDARRRMGALADALALDQVMGCRRSSELGWAPRHPPFLESADAVYREYRGSLTPTSGS